MSIVSTIVNLLTPHRRRVVGRHRRGVPALELLAALRDTAPTGWHVSQTAGWAPRVRNTRSLDPVTQIIAAVA